MTEHPDWWAGKRARMALPQEAQVIEERDRDYGFGYVEMEIRDLPPLPADDAFAYKPPHP